MGTDSGVSRDIYIVPAGQYSVVPLTDVPLDSSRVLAYALSGGAYVVFVNFEPSHVPLLVQILSRHFGYRLPLPRKNYPRYFGSSRALASVSRNILRVPREFVHFVGDYAYVYLEGVVDDDV